ncbi:MAG TPA: S8 family serine peptidase [Gemmatimonadaceae bacterium]|nr:S8 family serine peptidase [Gemmatimonadaceae bacterium]
MHRPPGRTPVAKRTAAASLALAATLGLALGGCSPDAPPTAPAPGLDLAAAAPAGPRSYILVAHDDGALPPGLEDDLRALGATLVSTIPQIGLAVAESDREDFRVAAASAIAGVDAVLPDLEMHGVEPAGAGTASEPDVAPFAGADALAAAAAAAAPPMPPGGDPRSPLQWALSAIHAPEAWALGYKGRGVRVAVLDAGIQSTHPDLAPNLNRALSTSFVPGESYDGPPGPHGTQVAGIIAAAQNGIGVVGVAPEAEIVAVKMLNVRPGPQPSSRAIQALIYAADIGADVANMSFGTNLPRRTEIVVDTRGTEDPSDDVRVRVSNADVIAYLRAFSRATNYAHHKGVTLIAAAGNLAKNFDEAQDDIGIPQELPHVITVGPTAPEGWALDPSTDLDRHPTYANIGSSYLALSAPGGGFDVVRRPGLPPSCTVLGFTNPCQVFDLVYTTNVGSAYFWNFGGSFAAPHATGVAALIIGKHGGSMDPDQVEAILRNTSDDLGKPGIDDFYGHGRVNALRAVEHR